MKRWVLGVVQHRVMNHPLLTTKEDMLKSLLTNFIEKQGFKLIKKSEIIPISKT